MAAFLSLAVPRELTIARRGHSSWVQRFFDGLLTLAERMRVPLAGGDMAEMPSTGGTDGIAADRRPGLLVADIVLIGAVRRTRALLRSGARAGDVICVTSAANGGLGGSAAELLALERNPKRFATLKSAAPGHPHLYPEPRIQTGLKLAANRLVTAAIDLSDGLSTDLRHLCEESGLAAEIDAEAIPVHPMALLAEAAGLTPSALDLALHGGEDYELLFTVPAEAEMPKRLEGVSIHAIGRMKSKRTDRPPVTTIGPGQLHSELPARGWEHFRRGPR